MAKLVMFIILAVIILASAVMSVMSKRIMRAATYLLFVLFGVAGLYFVLDYTYLGAAQISVYAGGVTMIYIFAIQLVNKNSLQGLFEKVNCKQAVKAAVVSLLGFIVVTAVMLKNAFINGAVREMGEVQMEKVGKALMGADKYEYVLPFEFISVFLLACIIGGLIVSRKEK